MKKPKPGPKPKTECFYCKGNGHWKRNYPKYLADKKDDKVNKGIFDTCSVSKISNAKHELQNKHKLVEDEVTMCVGSGSKIDMIIIAHSLYFRD